MCGLIHQNSKATVTPPLRSGSAIDGNIPTAYLPPNSIFFLRTDTSLGIPLSPVHRPTIIQHQNREVSIYPACRVLHWHGLLCFAASSSAYSRRGLYPQDKYIHSTRQLHSKASSKELQRDIRISPVLKPQGSTPSGALKGLRKPNLKAPSPDGRSMTGQRRVRCQYSCT